MSTRRSTAALAAVALFAAAAADADAVVRSDRTPPVFTGLASATTCIPGPVGGDRTSSFHLKWTPAKDAVTPASRIVYDIYQAPAPGRENFAAPTYTTRRGATTFATPPLSSAAPRYFVVRARDAAGNRDRNRRERQGMNLCV
jgi:hypothetical protein